MGDILETTGSVRALGGVNVGGKRLLKVGIDVIVDEDDVNGAGISAALY